jgi:hypothetical protein
LQLKFAEVRAETVFAGDAVGLRFGFIAKAPRDELLDCVTAANAVSLVPGRSDKVILGAPSTNTDKVIH